MSGHHTTRPGGGSKFKILAGSIYAILIVTLAGPAAISRAVADGQQAGSSGNLIVLDKYGARGRVQFNHDNHITRQNPDPNAVFKTTKGASCSGCHHTLDAVSGAPQLWKCSGCHRNSGD